MSKDPAAHIIAELSRKLAQERVRLGVSKRKLAEKAGFDRSTAAFIEDPAKNPTIYNLVRYGLALEIDVGEMLSEITARHLQKRKG